MERMTQSDLLLEVLRFNDDSTLAKAEALVNAMHRKISVAYAVARGIEEDPDFKEIGLLIRAALDS